MSDNSITVSWSGDSAIWGGGYVAHFVAPPLGKQIPMFSHHDRRANVLEEHEFDEGGHPLRMRICWCGVTKHYMQAPKYANTSTNVKHSLTNMTVS